MAKFPSQEWIDELVKVALSDKELIEIGKTWTHGGILTVLEPDEKFGERWLAFFLIDKGEIKEAKIVKDESEVEYAFLISAPYSVWKSIVKGKADPMTEFLKGSVKVKGNVGLLMQYAGFVRKFTDTLKKVPSEFPDEK